MVDQAKKVQKSKERKLKNEKKYQALLEILAKERLLQEQADNPEAQKERKILRQQSTILKQELHADRRLLDQLDVDVSNKMKTTEIPHINIVENQFMRNQSTEYSTEALTKQNFSGLSSIMSTDPDAGGDCEGQNGILQTQNQSPVSKQLASTIKKDQQSMVQR